MITSILSIVFLIVLAMFIYEITHVKSCDNCKFQNNCLNKYDARNFQHYCCLHKKADEIV